jgi:hypothetical protein
MPTTANNGWTIPADTDLVKDGASAIRTLGNAIDTTLGVYSASNPMAVKIATASFSGVTSFSLAANTFTTTYDHYKILVRFSSTTASSDITGRLRASGSDITASNYNTALIQGAYGSTALGNYNSASGNVFYLSYADGQAQNLSMEIMSPFLTATTGVFNHNDRQGYGSQIMGGVYKATTSVDSFTIASSGNMSGTYTVYGYTK